MQKMDGHDSISRGSPLVVERISSPSVDAIKKIHQAGARPLTGDDVTAMKFDRSVEDEAMHRLRAGATTLRKAISAPGLMDVKLPGQSSNATWSTADPGRAGGTSSIGGYVDDQFGAAPISGPRASSAESSPSKPPQDSDVGVKRKTRGVDVAAAADSPLQYEPDDDEKLDACTRAIKRAHRSGAKPDFPRS
jgi:hypothetical protein